jgi:hypothetical protein
MPTPVPEKPCGQPPQTAEQALPAVPEVARQRDELDDAALDQVAAGKGSKNPLGDPLTEPL